jgi:hypothetical protein
MAGTIPGTSPGTWAGHDERVAITVTWYQIIDEIAGMADKPNGQISRSTRRVGWRNYEQSTTKGELLRPCARKYHPLPSGPNAQALPLPGRSVTNCE